MGINLEKLFTTTTIRQSNLTGYAYNVLAVNKLYATVAVRMQTQAVGQASGSGQVTGLLENFIAMDPVSDFSVGGWKNESGGTTLYASVSKPSGVNDSTYIVATKSLSADTARIKVDIPPYEVGQTVYVDYRICKDPPDATQLVDMVVKLYQSSTLIASWTHTNISTTFTDFSQPLTAPQVAAITDYTQLYIEFVSNPQ